MADQPSEQTQTPDGRKLDQAAIDAAMAAMKAEDNAEEQASAGAPSGARATAGSQADPDSADDGPDTEPATLSNTGNTFAESADDGHQELDAAIAALQADDFEEETLYQKGDSGSPGDKQAKIDETVSAMQADGADPAAIDTDAGKGSTPGVRGWPDTGGLNISTDDVVHAGETDDEQPEGDGGHAGRSSDRTAATEASTAVSDSEPGPENGNKFSDLEQSEPEHSPAGGLHGADGRRGENGFPDGRSNIFSGLDDEDAGPAEAITGEAPEAAGAVEERSGDASAKSGRQAPAGAESEKRGSNVSEKGRKPAGAKKKSGAILLAGAVLLVGLTAFFGRDFYSKYVVGAPPPPRAPEKSPAPPDPPPSQVRPETALHDSCNEKIQEVARLRAGLLAKKEDVDELKQFYRDGISELEEQIQLEAASHDIKEFSRASAVGGIKLDLQTIQRRRAYMQELEKPSYWLHQGSEELLFLSRRTEIDLQMSAVASGIELTRHIRALNAGLQKYQISPGRLAIDAGAARLQPLEEIWKAVVAQDNAVAARAVTNGDLPIIEDICDGRTEKIAELSTLTIRAAKCLAQLDTSQFVLNHLTSMSPVAAKHLSGWRGRWLCLNGFRRLPPDVARHLFRWEGSWISLNGLAEFPAQIGELLLSWEGRQLELMGLVHDPDHPERIGLQQLAQWESAGGKLFVPERIRAGIDKLK